MGHWLNRTFGTPTLTRIIVVAVICAAVIPFAAYRLSEGTVARLSDEDKIEVIRNSLVKNCEENGNRLRRALAQNIQAQINRVRANIPLTRKFFPSIPPATLRRLTERQITSLVRQKERVKPIGCARIFPKP